VLGYFAAKLDRILYGLFLKPIRRRKIVRLNPKPIRRRRGSILDKLLGWASLAVTKAGLGLPSLDFGSSTWACGVQIPVLVSPVVDEEQFRFEGGRRLASDASSSVIDVQSAHGVQSPALVSPVVDEEQVHLEGGRRSTSDSSSPESSTGSVWSDGVFGHIGDGSDPFLPPLTVMGPTAAGEGADSSLVVSAVSVPFGVGTESALVHAALNLAGDETKSFSSGSVETGRAFAGDGSESYSFGGGSVSTAASDGSAFLHDIEVWSFCITSDVASPAGSVSIPDGNESAILEGSLRLLDTKHLSFGLNLASWVD
jgi:hypothetical protein